MESCPDCGEDMRCDNWAVAGYTRCANHGGPAPARNFYGRGTITTGKGSSFLITRLAEGYRRQMSDGRVLSNRAAVEMIDQRIIQLAERVDNEEAPQRFNLLYKEWQNFKTLAPDDPEYLVRRKNIDNLFEQHFHDYASWTQMFDAFDLRSKVVEREVKVLKEIKAIMTHEEGMNLVAQLMAAVMEIVGDDPKKLKQAQYVFSRIVGDTSELVEAPDPGPTGGGG